MVPVHNISVPDGVMLDVGLALMVTYVGADTAEHPDELVTLTVYPPVPTTTLCAVDPLLHRYEVPALEVSVTVPPH